jgi:hypothetical protein
LPARKQDRADLPDGIFRKLSITSRVELARIVIEQAADRPRETSHLDDVSARPQPR